LEIAILEPKKLSNKFPEPITVPKEVPEARKERYRALVGSATQGIWIRSFIALVSLVAALIYGSASLFMDALATSLDIASSLVLMLSFKLASRPPDMDHPFGHGRYEPLAGLQLGLFLVFLGGGMFFYNTTQLNQPETYTSLHRLLWVIPLVSTILLEFSYRTLIRTAQKTDSPALAADAMHYRVDSITSVFAMIALLLGSFSPRFSHLFDHIGAALISIFMMIVGLNAARKNMNQLTDKIPNQDYFDRIKKAALNTPGVKGTEKIRMQLFGPDAHVNIDIEVEPKLTVEVAHEISQKVRVEIQKEMPQVRDVIVHMEPYYPDDH
jgi:cation diffusion facilitator family transporter